MLARAPVPGFATDESQRGDDVLVLIELILRGRKSVPRKCTRDLAAMSISLDDLRDGREALVEKPPTIAFESR